MKDEEIARSLQIGSGTVERVRRRCVEQGVEAALGRREQLRRRPKKLDGSGEAHPVSSTGQALIAWPGRTTGGPGELDAETVGRPFGGPGDRGEHRPGDGAAGAQKNQLKPWLKDCWHIPPQGSAEFVCHKEDMVGSKHPGRGTWKLWYALTRPANSKCRRPANRVRPGPGLPGSMIKNTGATA